jgi:hypothetical protein
MYVSDRVSVREAIISWILDASNDVHSGMMVYRSLMKTARLSRTQLMPERYTVDLAVELNGRGNGDVISRTSHDDSGPTVSEDGGGTPHRHAYSLWRQGYGLLDICISMQDRANPQSETVVMCVCMSKC